MLGTAVLTDNDTKAQAYVSSFQQVVRYLYDTDLIPGLPLQNKSCRNLSGKSEISLLWFIHESATSESEKPLGFDIFSLVSSSDRSGLGLGLIFPTWVIEQGVKILSRCPGSSSSRSSVYLLLPGRYDADGYVLSSKWFCLVNNNLF